MNDIVGRMKERLRSGSTDQDPVAKPCHARPITATALAREEAQLGFSLPPELKRLYVEIGNGGFGPGYGLLGLFEGKADDTGKTAPELYRLYHDRDPEDAAWAWPEGLLPICHWGCAIYSCIDCLDPTFRMRMFDPNAHASLSTWTDAFFEECDSFSKWITDWSSGVNLWDRMYGENGPIASEMSARNAAP